MASPALTVVSGTSRDRLHEIIREKSFHTGRFKLASGKEADYFFDMKPTVLDPEGGRLIADQILNRLEARPDVSAIGGLVLGAVPIISVVSALSYDRSKPIPGFFVRKEAKGHGTNQLIDGNLEAGQKVVLVDDVITTGGSVTKALDAVRERRCEVDEVFTIVDRLEGGAANLKKLGVELVSIFDRKDFMD